MRKSMSDSGIDVLVLTDEKNITYLTDYRTLSWAYHARPALAVVSQSALSLVVNRFEENLVTSTDRPFTALFYRGYLPDAIETVASEVGRLSAHRKPRIGVDYGQDFYGRGSLELIALLAEASSSGRVESAVDLIWSVRMLKSPFEAHLKRNAFEIVNHAFDSVVAAAHIGITEYEMCRRLQAQVYLNGAESTAPISMLFAAGDFLYSRPPSERRLREGHYVWTDFRATYGGYPADRNRIARAGEPTAEEARLYSLVRELTIEIAKGVRPGRECREVFCDFSRLWHEAGVGPMFSGVSRIGHGGGMDVTEPPSISEADTTLITPGMIVHIEPKLERDGAIFQFEEVVFVTESGGEFLSALSPSRVPVIH
jgi:Xaa-Pro aminopeptidase